MKKLKSVSLFVGTSHCNASCKHCAGIPLRKDAPSKDGLIDQDLILQTLQQCYEQGARSLSISSSGEPTLSPESISKTLHLVSENPHIAFDPINMYSNGIRIGKDKEFCDHYLPLWKSLGLSKIYVTIHSIDEEKNAKIYGVNSYPPLEQVISRIHDADLLMRANLVLSKETFGSLEDFTDTVEHLVELGVDQIASWPIRTLEDNVDYHLSPKPEIIAAMQRWAKEYQGIPIRVLGEEQKEVYEKGTKLTLFPNGTLSHTWCN